MPILSQTFTRFLESVSEDSDEDDEPISIPTPILEQIEQEKAQRQNERLSIQQDKEILARRKKYLEDAKKEIDQARNDLDVREIKILQVEPLLPIARQLQELSLGFDDIIPWIEMIREKAHIENIDLKTAAYNVTHELREYRQLGSLHKRVQQVKQQLAVLDAFTAQKQQAITTLMNLQLAGFSEKDINELIGLVTA